VSELVNKCMQPFTAETGWRKSHNERQPSWT